MKCGGVRVLHSGDVGSEISSVSNDINGTLDNWPNMLIVVKFGLLIVCENRAFVGAMILPMFSR